MDLMDDKLLTQDVNNFWLDAESLQKGTGSNENV